jgi:hypothetical protein
LGAVTSWWLSKLSLKEWFKDIYIAGVRKIGLAMAKLSREYVGKREKEWWEDSFAAWWSFSIKYFVPFALWFLINFSLKADLDTPYGGYHPFWQFMGWCFPAAGVLVFLIPLFFPPSQANFTKEQL